MNIREESKVDRRLVHIYTGDGKGKTTAALGLAMRAKGSGLTVLIVQFLKGRDTGELKALRKLGIPVIRSDVKKFIPYMNPEELKMCKQEQSACFDKVQEEAAQYDLVVLDEIFGAVSTGMVAESELIHFVKTKAESVELVLTGRDASDEMIGLADYVSEIQSLKHPYDKGIQARRGIEF